MPTVAALRAEARSLYDRGRGKKSLKGYNAKSKAWLLQALGYRDELKAHLQNLRSVKSAKTAAAVAGRLGGDSATRKAQIKGRLLRGDEVHAVNRTFPVSQADATLGTQIALGREPNPVMVLLSFHWFCSMVPQGIHWHLQLPYIWSTDPADSCLPREFELLLYEVYHENHSVPADKPIASRYSFCGECCETLL